LLGWRGVQGAVSGVFPAAVALVSALTPEARLSRSLAMLQSARAAGALCGPLIGGVLADLIGIRGLFFGVGAIAAATGVVCSLVLVEPSSDEAHAAAGGSRIGWRELLRAPASVGMLALLVLYQAGIMCSWPTLALFVEHLGVARAGVATTTGALVFAAGLPATLTATAWPGSADASASAPPDRVARLHGVASLAVGATSRLAVVFPLRVLSGLHGRLHSARAEWINGRTRRLARADGRPDRPQ
jgi:MFS family permease